MRDAEHIRRRQGYGGQGTQKKVKSINAEEGQIKGQYKSFRAQTRNPVWNLESGIFSESLSYPVMILIIFFSSVITFFSVPVLAADVESICYGTTSNGRLKNGVTLPSKGPNFESYTSLGGVLGRTYVHSRVRDVIFNSFKTLESSHPETVYVYGETGKKYGGPFKPHRTHQNGLSVDFMVPIVNTQNHSIPLPTNAFNKYGYGIEFDAKGQHGSYRIDFEAMAAHLLALKQETDRSGIGIWPVVFDPQLQPFLLATQSGPLLRQNNISFSKKRSWIRHDEHYHVDFIVACEEIETAVK
jgi:penicillin-insensitive murein endopeptidase